MVVKKEYLLLVLIFSVLIACKKEDKVVEDSVVIDNHLNLHPEKRAYYNLNSNRYESAQFTSDQKAFNYSLESYTGKKYRVMVFGIPMSEVTLELRDNQGSVIQTGGQANVGLTSKYLVFTAAENVSYQIHVQAENDVSLNKFFFLSYEEVGTCKLTWKGQDYLCDGDWEVNSQNQLIHIGHNSGFSKWLKMADKNFLDCQIDLGFVVPTNGLGTSLGVMVNSSNNVYDLLNLPDIGLQYRLSGFKDWEFWYIGLGNGDGVGRVTGTINQPMAPGLNNLLCTVQQDSLRYFINGNRTHTVLNESFGSYPIYLTAEDLGTDTLVCTEFVIQ